MMLHETLFDGLRGIKFKSVTSSCPCFKEVSHFITKLAMFDVVFLLSTFTGYFRVILLLHSEENFLRNKT